jgi:protoheme IX farnesyltransferase
MNREELITPPVAAAAAEESAPGMLADLMTLTKARLSSLVLVTTFVGFCMGSRGGLDWFLLLRTLLGTALVAGAAAVLNQWVETNVDRLMNRTKGRPLPAGRMRRSTALGLGILLAVAGLIYLANRVNPLAAILAACTLAVYVLLYTPLKRRTPFCITVGAVSGGIPPMIGWAAAHGSLEAGAWILFGLLFLWQMPHFLAIAWMYRDEYAEAGFVMLRRNDIGGRATAQESLWCTLALIAVSQLPLAFGLVRPIYLAGTLLCGTMLLACALQFLRDRTRLSARRLFLASIIYLPLILGLMVLSKS